MRKEYFKPVTEIIESFHESLLAAESKEHENDWVGGKDNNPEDDGEGDIWNPKYNIWD